MTVDSRLKMLEKLSLMDKDSEDRKPYAERTRQELDEAHEAQGRIDAMEDDSDENETPEDAEDLPEWARAAAEVAGKLIARLEDEVERLTAEVERSRSANIDMNAKLIESNKEAKQLKQHIARIQAEHTELFGDGDGK